MTKKQKSLAAVLTLLCFFVSNLSGFAAPQIQTAGGFSDVQGVSTFEINIPSDLGTIENLHSGSGPALIHIQTAHGNYEAQKKIQGILEYLKQNYGVKLVLLEGSSFKFDSEYLRFFPDQMNVTRDIADRLTKQALVKGAELFLMDNPDVQAYGIEKLETYRANGDAFKAVLTQQQKTEGFLQGMNMQIERLTSPYLNKDLRSFLARLDDFEAKKVPLMDWVSFLRGQTEKFLNIDLSDAAYQVDWPMMVRLFTLSEFEKKMDMAAYGQEKTGFLQAIKAVPADTRAQIEKLLNSPISRHQLADPETGILFERMVSALPQDFDFSKFPNVKLFIGHLILQSEIHSDVLMAEMDRLVEKISVRLAQTPEEKKLLSILSDYRLLKKLFALELTPGDYDKLVVRGEEARPDRVAESFLEINGSKRVKDIKFEHLEDINLLQERALEFYRLVKERDNAMTANIEDRLKKEGVDKAVVITGGFHAQPFEDFFASQGYAYALISPKITSLEGDTGRKAYVNSILQNRNYIKQTYESPSGVSHTAAETAQVGADPYYIAPFIISDADAAFAAQGNPLNLEQLGTSLGATRWFQEQFGGVSLGYVNEGPATAVEVRYPTGIISRLATAKQVITTTRLGISPAVTSSEEVANVAPEAGSENLQASGAQNRSEMRVLPAGITPDEESWGPLYASGEIVQEPVKGNIRATQRGEIPAIRTMSPEERAFYTKVFVEAARRGWVASMILTGGAGTRMPLNSYPPALRTPLSQRFELVTRNQGWQVVNSQPFGEKDEMLLSLLVTAEGYQQQSQVMGSPEFKTKGLIPAVEIGGRWKTFLGLDALNMARFIEQLGIPKEKMPYIAALGADNQVAIKRFLEAGGFANKLDIVTYVGYPGKRVVAHEKDTAAVIAGLKKKRGDNQGRLDRNEYRDLSEKSALEKENALLDQQLADLDTDAYREYARLNAGKVLPVAAPRGHGGILHNMFNDYSNQELILKLAQRGTKFVFMRNIDNTVARKDEDWAVFMGYMIAGHFDLLLQGSLRPEGQSGGAFITHLDRPGQPIQSAEDPSLKGTSVNPKEAPFINNAVAGAAILDYMTQVYHTSRRELAEIARIREASVRHAREAEIRSRGFGRYPINPVPKVVQITNHPEHPLNGKWVVGTGVETNMWESSGIVTDAAPIEVELAQERIEVSAIINGAEQDVANQARRARQYGSNVAADLVAARINYEALLRTAQANLDQSIVSRNEQNRDWHQAEIDYLLSIQKSLYEQTSAPAINNMIDFSDSSIAQLEIRRRAQGIYERRTESDGANGVVGRPVQTTRVSAVEVGSVEDIRNYLRRKMGLGTKDKVTNQMVEEYLERIKGTADYDEFLQELRWVNFAPTKDWNDYEGINAEILKFVAPIISTGTLIRSEMRLSREAVTPEKKRRELMGEEADETGLLTPVGEMRPIQEIDRDILTAEQVEKAPTGPRGPEEVGDPLRRSLEIQTPGAMPRPQTTNTRTRAGVVAGAGNSNQVSDSTSGIVNVTVTGIRQLEQGETAGGDQVRIYSAPMDADSVAALLGSPYLPPSLRSFWATGSSPVGEGPALLLAEVGEGKEIEFVGFDRPFVPVLNMPPAVNPARITPILERQPDNIIPELRGVTVAVSATGLNIRPLLNGRPATISLSPIRNLNVNPAAALATRSELRDIAALLDQAAPSNGQGQVNNIPTRIAALEGLVPDKRIPQTPLNTAAVPGLIRLIAANEDREIADRLTLALISNIPAVINDVNIILDAGQRLQLADALRTDGVKAIAADRITSGKADLADVKFILGLISVSNIPAFALDNSAALIATAKVLAGIAADETVLRNDRLVALQALAFVLPVITASNDIRSEKLGQVLAGIVTKQAAKTAENKLDQNYFLNAANAALTALGEQGVEELLPIIAQPQIPSVLAEILRLRRLPVTPLVEIASSNASTLQQKIAALDTLKRFADRTTAINPSAVESSVKPSDAVSIAALVANPKNSEAFRVDAARVLGTLGTAAAPALSILSSINPAAEAQPQQLTTLGTVLAQAIVDIRGRSELRNYVAEAVSPSRVTVDAELPAPGVNQNTAAGRISRSSLTVTTQFTAFIIRFRTQLAVFVQQGPQVVAAIVSEVLGREAYAATISTGQPVASLDEIAPVGSYQITPKFYTELPGVKVPGTATGEGIGRELFEYGLLKLLAKDNSEALVSLLKGFSDLQPAGQKQLLAVFLPQGVTKDDFYKMLAASIRNKNSGLASTADQQALIDKLELFIEAMPLLPGQTEVEESNAYVAANKGVARIGSGVVEGVKGAAQLGIDNDIDLRDSRQAIAVVLAAISMKRAADLIHGIENDLIRGQVLSNYVAQHLDGLEQDGSGFKLTRKNIGQLLRFLYAVQAYVETRA